MDKTAMHEYVEKKHGVKIGFGIGNFQGGPYYQGTARKRGKIVCMTLMNFTSKHDVLKTIDEFLSDKETPPRDESDTKED